MADQIAVIAQIRPGKREELERRVPGRHRPPLHLHGPAAMSQIGRMAVSGPVRPGAQDDGDPVSATRLNQTFQWHRESGQARTRV
jgi:hypothetical protein